MEQPLSVSTKTHDKCAEEKIHIPGAIQPHGVLLALSEETLSIVQVSESVFSIIGITPEKLLGQSIEILIGKERKLELARQLVNGTFSSTSAPLTVYGPTSEHLFDATIYRTNGLLVLELERLIRTESQHSLESLQTNEQAVSQLLTCSSQSELLQSATELIRELTGFDRVMTYIFDSEWNGTVLAESKSSDAHSYLGLKFPASDIPEQARELYKRNPLRLLAEVNAKPSAIIPSNNPLTSAPLDLSHSLLRALSPVHIEYLNNMGVNASMSISLISQGELRGLIVCHHNSPKHADHRIRRACLFVGRLVSLQNDALEERETFKRLEVLKDARKDLLLHLSGQDFLPSALADASSLLDVVGAKGAAVVWDEHCSLVGSTPDKAHILEIVSHLSHRTLPVFVTDSLKQFVPSAEFITDSASGLLAIRLALSGSRWLLWFRPECLEELSWAGKNEKIDDTKTTTNLHPRKSFEQWKELVAGKSQNWLSCEVKSALDLRTDLLDIILSVSEKARASILRQQVEQLNTFSEDLLVARDAVMQTSLLRSDMICVDRQSDSDKEINTETIHRILVVENDCADFAFMERQLSAYNDAGLLIEHSKCLADALKQLKTDPVDIIFLDLTLSDYPGVSAIELVHTAAPETPIIVLALAGNIKIALEALKYGAEGYLLKDSIDKVSLDRSINFALKRRRARLANEKLAAIVEASEEATICKTLDGTITSWNEAASILFGYSKEEAIGKSISMLIPPESTRELDGILQSLSKGESIRDLETVRINKAGRRLEILAKISPLRTADGTIIGAAAIDRDNTERKQAQKVLHESEERYELLVARVKDYATFMLDADGLVESWNEGAQRLEGYDSNEVLGKPFSIFYLPEEQERHVPESHLDAAVSNGCFEQTCWRQRKDGSRFFAEVVIVPRFSDANQLLGFTKITRDITNKILAEQEIAESRLRLSLALEAGAVGVWDINLTDKLVWRSLRHDEIFGHKEPLTEWNFDIFASYVLQEDLALSRAAFKKGLEDGQFNLECRIIRAGDNALRWIAARGQTFYDEQGFAIRMLGTIVDFTDEKVQQEQQRLLAIVDEREDFMATLTHDMKNPLLGANRLLELFIAGNMGQVSSAQTEIFQCLKESNSALLKLIADLIDVYRLEKGSNDLLTSECDLAKVVTGCVSRIMPFAKLRDIKVDLKISKELIVKADAKKLERVIQNLLDNAMKFTLDGSTIVVRAQIQNAQAVIEVEDTGPGISLEEQPRLFKRFSQGAAGKRYTGGSGLGLYLCKQIVEAHAGQISCESQPNKITIFRVVLPMNGQS